MGCSFVCSRKEADDIRRRSRTAASFEFVCYQRPSYGCFAVKRFHTSDCSAAASPFDRPRLKPAVVARVRSSSTRYFFSAIVPSLQNNKGSPSETAAGWTHGA
jgi:hypothetical protein